MGLVILDAVEDSGLAQTGVGGFGRSGTGTG